jgi:V8-like Glu-specific endopeptidase
MLIIRHRTGPLAGKEETPQGRQPNRVVFGRDPDACDVVYPPDALIIARRHFALVLTPHGDWTVELFGTPYVAVNGEPADPEEAVTNGSLVELGHKGGPSFEVTVTEEATTGNLARTLPQEEVEASHAIAHHAEFAAMRARRLGLAAVGLAVVAAVIGGTYTYFRNQWDQEFQSQLAELHKDAAKIAADNIPRAFRDNLAKAAFLVVQRDSAGKERGNATAFPIGPNLLATAGHVAAERDDLLKKGIKLFVRSPGIGTERKTWEVTAHRVHPAYEPLDEFLTKDPLVMPSTTSGGDALGKLGLRSLTSGQALGYDVGLLQVEGPPLSPILELATSDEALKLAQGDPLAYAGYPQENIAGSELFPISATPEVRLGTVTGITDLFSMATDPAHRQLVHHNMGTTVGTSGSPIISTQGKVVALHNRSTYVTLPDGRQVPSGALINYAQRIDLLRDLMSGDAYRKLDEEKRYWGEQTKDLKRGFEAISGRLLENLKPAPNATAEVVAQEEEEFDEEDQVKIRGKDNVEIVQRRQVQHAKLKAGERHTFLAYGNERTKLGLYLLVGGKPVEQVEPSSWYPVISFTAPKDMTVEVYVSAPDIDVSYTFVNYVWRMPKS